MKIEIDPKNVRILDGRGGTERRGLPFRYRLYIAGTIAIAEFVVVVSKVFSWFHWWVAAAIGFVLIAGWWETRGRIRSSGLRQLTQIVCLSQILLALVLVVVPVSVIAAAVVFIAAILIAGMILLGRRA